MRHAAIFFRPRFLSSPTARWGIFKLPNLDVRATKRAMAEYSETGTGVMEKALDNSLFVRLVSVRPNLEFRKGGSHDHWTDDAW